MRLIVALVLAMLFAGAIFSSLLSPEDSNSKVVEAELAGVKYAYVRAYARDDATAAGGLADRLAFVASFPAFAALSQKQRAASASVVTLTVSPKGDGLEPAERPGKLYARFLTADALAGPGGLVLRHFEQGSPYDFEELFLAPPDGRDFFARCPKRQDELAPETCLSIFRDRDFDVELRYPANLLENWDALYDGARRLLARMTRSAARP